LLITTELYKNTENSKSVQGWRKRCSIRPKT